MSIRSDPALWTDPRHRRGLAGERIAIRYLKSEGWDILAHRFRIGRAEIDVVARRDQVVAFVEVKARWSESFGEPVEAVTPRKQREIARVAQGWIDRFGNDHLSYRMDVIGISVRHGKLLKLVHVPDAFRSGWR